MQASATGNWVTRTHGQDFELTRHFFGGLFESELLSVRERLLGILAGIFSLCFALALVLPMLFIHKYDVLNVLPSATLYREAVLADKLMFIGLSFVLTGLVTALQWQALFPGVRDFLILGPLPLKRIQIFRAKFAALFLFITLFIIGINFVPSLFLPAVMSGRWQLHHGSLLLPLSLFISLCLAGYFAFFLLLVVQGVLMSILPAQLFERCSLYVQATAVLIFLTALPLLLWIPDLHHFMTRQPPSAFWLPPAWFLGLGETLLGSTDRFTLALGHEAQQATLAIVLLALLLYSITYFRRTDHLLEAPGRVNGVGNAFASGMLRLLVRNPAEAAILSFILKTFLRSRIHKLVLAGIAGISCSLVADSFLSLWINGSLAHHIIRAYDLKNAALSAPLVVCFFLLCGIRYLFSVPVEPRGNWIFRLSAGYREGHPDTSVADATEKALLLLGVAPVVLTTFLLLAVSLGAVAAFLHTVFVALMSLVLSEALLWNWDRIPFTCPYLPGKRHFIQSLLLYGIALTFFAYAATTIEMSTLPFPGRRFALYGFLFATFAFLRFHRKKNWTSGIVLKFDDLPEPDVQKLNLQPE